MKEEIINYEYFFSLITNENKSYPDREGNTPLLLLIRHFNNENENSIFRNKIEEFLIKIKDEIIQKLDEKDVIILAFFISKLQNLNNEIEISKQYKEIIDQLSDETEKGKKAELIRLCALLGYKFDKLFFEKAFDECQFYPWQIIDAISYSLDGSNDFYWKVVSDKIVKHLKEFDDLTGLLNRIPFLRKIRGSKINSDLKIWYQSLQNKEYKVFFDRWLKSRNIFLNENQQKSKEEFSKAIDHIKITNSIY